MQICDPYISTPHDLVKAKLEFGEACSEDLVVDLGCGDGRVLICAAQEYDAWGVGVDVQPGVVEEARSNIIDLDLDDMVTVQQQDFRETDLSEADLVILYLTTRTLFQLSDKLRELPVGARIVTHDFALPGWKISEQTTFDSVESGRCFELFLYVQD